MMEDGNPVLSDVVVQSSPVGAKARVSIGSITALVVLILILGASVWYANEWKDGLRIRRVLIEGNHIVPATEIFQLTNITPGARMYATDLDRVRRDVMKQAYIKSASVARELPNSVRVCVEERRPVAAISRGELVFLDDEGFVLPQYSSNTMIDVPFVTGFSEPAVLQPGRVSANPEIHAALGLLRQAQEVGSELYHLISEIHVEPDGDVVLYSSDAGVTILVGKTDVQRKFWLLKAFWDQAVSRQGAERLQLVDLRFEDQVIARWSNTHRDLTRMTAF